MEATIYKYRVKGVPSMRVPFGGWYHFGGPLPQSSRKTLEQPIYCWMRMGCVLRVPKKGATILTCEP